MNPPSALTSRTRTKLAVALAAAVALVVSACGAGDGGSTEDRDQITVGLSALPIGLDPVTYNDAETAMVYKLVNESLYRYTGPEEITPLLAAEMPEVSKDGKTWTIPLKKGVEFTNGDEFDAEDVVYTFNTVLDPDNGSYNRSALVALKSVRAVDSHTVELELTHKFTPMMYQLTRLSIVTSSIEYKPGETYATELVGTGPYTLAKVTRGQEIVLEANEEFREEGVPNIPEIVVKEFPDANSLLTAMKGDEIQVMPDVSLDTVDTVKEFASVYQSDSDLVATRYWLWPNIASGLMSDERVRQAVDMAIDRGRVVDNTLRGYGYPISTLPAAKEGAMFSSDLAQTFGTDPQLEEAAQLVEDAGVAGEKLHLVVPTGGAMTDIADSVQQQLEEIGFEIQREDLSQAAALDRLFNGNLDLYLNGSTSAAGDSGLDGTFGLYRKEGAYNLNGVDDPELDELATKAVQTDEPDELVEQMRERQLEYVPGMPIAVAYTLTAFAEDLEGFEMYNYGDFYGFAYME